MVTDVLKRLRDVLAFALLGVAALYLISGLTLLFRSSQIGESFAFRAGSFGYLFTVPALVLSLVAAVVLAVAFGETSRHAKVVVLVALAIGGLSLLCGVICWLTALSAGNGSFGPLSGLVLRQGKLAGGLLRLAHLGLLALAMLFAYSVFSRLPRSVRAPQPWDVQQGYGPQQPYPGAQPYSPYGPPGYGGQQPDRGQPGQGYGPPQAGQSGWVPQPEQRWAQPAPDQGWGQPPAEQPGWAQPLAPAQPRWGSEAQPAWGPPPGDQPPWGPPPEQPTAPQDWGRPPGEPEWEVTTAGAQTWGQPTADQPEWGTTAEQQQTSTGATAADQTTTGEPVETSGPPGPADERSDRAGDHT